MLYLHHATLFTPELRIDEGAVLVEAGQIQAVGPAAEIPCPPGAATVDATGLILAPGFIDLQINGAFGHDFTADPASIWPVAARLPRYGVTAFLPTVITSPLETIAEAQAVVGCRSASIPPGARPLGLHVEGPFLNPDKKGAHNPAYLRDPDVDAADGWSPEKGVRMVTLAPELPGALDLVASLAERGVLVSAGHSAATLAQAQAGLAAGVRYGTHLFNAMPPLHHREPGLVGALLTDDRATTGLIADGIHSHPSMVALAWQALGSARLNLVTDAMAALGMPPGRHILADFEVWVDSTSARLADGTLAGSILSLDRALRNLLAYTGCTLKEALPAITTTPARLLGLAGTRGRIAPGYAADLVLLTPDLQVAATLVDGAEVYRRTAEGERT
ncbi:MAG: N-acetylglucosamine-6-phosphate deacetylase [Anaerolineae bacterium]|nr:N-acetylglucosamine-6-phosphate deacetylase [Anaerolineae bacterium]